MLVLVLNSESSSIACWGLLHNPPHAAHGMSTVVHRSPSSQRRGCGVGIGLGPVVSRPRIIPLSKVLG